jgi:hypothetical protein
MRRFRIGIGVGAIALVLICLSLSSARQQTVTSRIVSATNSFLATLDQNVAHRAVWLADGLFVASTLLAAEKEMKQTNIHHQLPNTCWRTLPKLNGDYPVQRSRWNHGRRHPVNIGLPENSE